MARVFITGSSEGLGLLAGKILSSLGHQVVLHARSEEKAHGTKLALSAAEAVVIGDVSTLKGIKAVAEQVNALGKFTAVIHNVGMFQVPDPQYTSDGITKLFAVNVVAPYVLTKMIQKPERLVYLSSGMHKAGRADLNDPQWKKRPWDTTQAYSDSKLFDLILAKGFAKMWPDIFSNAVDPGWVPTRMGGPSAPDNLEKGAETQAWLAASNDSDAKVTGMYFHHKKSAISNPLADDPAIQEEFFTYMKSLTGI